MNNLREPVKEGVGRKNRMEHSHRLKSVHPTIGAHEPGKRKAHSTYISSNIEGGVTGLKERRVNLCRNE